jgi:hypothetical protein
MSRVHLLNNDVLVTTTLFTGHNTSFLTITRQFLTEAQLWFSGGHTLSYGDSKPVATTAYSSEGMEIYNKYHKPVFCTAHSVRALFPPIYLLNHPSLYLATHLPYLAQMGG